MDLREEGARGLAVSFFNMDAHTTVCADALSCTDILSIKSHLPLQSHLTQSAGLVAEMKALAGTKDTVHDGNILHLVRRLECFPCSLPSKIWPNKHAKFWLTFWIHTITFRLHGVTVWIHSVTFMTQYYL